ncbi:MAG: hypothetical protein JWN73_5169 [Betaproteobacteria bacterium]|nr:hypothetical protein [Betaproteobacteria bacterium]
MSKETLVSFIFAVCVVGGSMFLFAKASGGLPQALAANEAPAAAPTATCADGDKANCAPPAKATSAVPEKPGAAAAQVRQIAAAAQAQAQVQAEVDAPEDEAATPPEQGKPRCKAIGHQVLGIDGALASPLSPAVREYYTKQRRALLDEKGGLAC